MDGYSVHTSIATEHQALSRGNFSGCIASGCRWRSGGLMYIAVKRATQLTATVLVLLVLDNINKRVGGELRRSLQAPGTNACLLETLLTSALVLPYSVRST